jgi:AhpD family alkylhydroperoxidase
MSVVTQRSQYAKTAAAGMAALGAVHAQIMKSNLPKGLVNLVYLRASQINGCAYCIDMHTRDLIADGADPRRLQLLAAWRDTGNVFSVLEQAALQWTETITLITDTHAPDADYAVAAEHFNEKDLADLTIAIGLINAYNRMSIGFRQLPALAKVTAK